MRLKKRLERVHFEGRASRSYNRCAKRPVHKAVLLQAEKHLFTLANFHTAEVQLSLTGPYRCRRAAGVNSSCGGKLSTFHLPICLSTSAMQQRELTLPPCFRTFKGRMSSPQVSPPFPILLGCQISDPKATKEMQSDVQLNMQSFNYKRKGATHLTPVEGPGVFNCMTVHSWTLKQGFLVCLEL